MMDIPSQMLKQPLRGRLYAALQGLRGRPLSRFVRQLREWERLPAQEFERLHAERLRWLLGYACEHVPLYRTGPWENAVSGRGAGLETWPVLEREVLRARSDELRAQPRPPQIVTRRTSGSTGTPAMIVLTPHADTWGWAHRYRGLLWHGIPIGVRSLRLSHDRRPLRDFLLNHRSVPALDTREAIESAVRVLREERPPLVAGPPSSLFYLARCLRERSVDGPLAPFARVGGEQLFPFQRAEIEKYLGARVVNSYGCTEIGGLAGECAAGSLHVYAEHVHLEIFNGESPAKPGELGDIVVTALNNPAMPLVRYRVGDRGRLSPHRCCCGLPHPVLVDLQAYLSDTFRAADGIPHHGSELVTQLGGFFTDPVSDSVRQVQFGQIDSRTWRVWVEASNEGLLRVAMNDRLACIVRQVFGAECSVETRVVGTIPREHGKLRYFRVEK
jgi:phenylacetate-CoA ligase